MPEITGGRVVYSRTVQPAQFESKRVEAELAFVIGEGEDPVAVLADVGRLVKTSALELIRGPELGQRDGGGPDPDSENTSRRRFRRRSESPDDEIPS